MKKQGLFAASVAAVSATALSATSSSFVCNSNFQFPHQVKYLNLICGLSFIQLILSYYPFFAFCGVVLLQLNSLVWFQVDVSKEDQQKFNFPSEKSSSTDKFAPRFDGLRFIETLITAHR